MPTQRLIYMGMLCRIVLSHLEQDGNDGVKSRQGIFPVPAHVEIAGVGSQGASALPHKTSRFAWRHSI